MNTQIIKLKKVKDLDQLNTVSDRWHNRSNYLKSIWQDDHETEERRRKAFKAWEPYFMILTALVPIYTKATSEMYKGFEKAGIVSTGEVHSNEVIIQKIKNPILLAELNTFEEMKTKINGEIIRFDTEIKNIDELSINAHGSNKEKSEKTLKELVKDTEKFNKEIKENKKGSNK